MFGSRSWSNSHLPRCLTCHHSIGPTRRRRESGNVPYGAP